MGNRDRHYRTLQTMVIVGRITLPLGVGGRLSVQVVRLAAGFAQARRRTVRIRPFRRSLAAFSGPKRLRNATTCAKSRTPERSKSLTTLEVASAPHGHPCRKWGARQADLIYVTEKKQPV